MSDIGTIIEQIFREQHGRVLAALIGHFSDFALAEDALQDALIVALQRWDVEGVPDNPAAWITTIAKRRAIDRLRREATFTRKQAALLESLADENTPDEDEEAIMSIPDERLKLMFTCCHPSLSLDAQVALTLKTLGGLSTGEIARAFLVLETTMIQRLARARGKIRDAGIPYRVPPAHLLPERLDALLAVVYLIFNEGYRASRGDTLTRKELSNEAIRLARALVELLPYTVICAEARGLLALMLLHDSRGDARVNAKGELVTLDEQDRSLWDQGQIAEGIAILESALALKNPGPYQLQAAISAVHAEAKTADATDWHQIGKLYRILAQMNPSPVVDVNRAVAISMEYGPQEGLRLLLKLDAEMADYYPYHVARADLLRRAQEREAAADAYRQALALCENQLERAYLEKRLGEVEA